MNINLLETILTSECEYWVIQKENSDSQGDELQPTIMMIAIPITIDLGKKRGEIKLIDLEKLNSTNLDGNIILNQNYPPFQAQQTLNNVSSLFPIPHEQKEFLIQALKFVSDDIRRYEKIITDLKPK